MIIVELFEIVTDALHRLHRGRVLGGKRDCVRLTDHFQLRDDDVDDHDERNPAQEDRHAEQPDETRDHRVRADLCVAHAAA
jgi:hypothetical protein